MSKSAPETIVLKGDPLYKEAEANGTITPGHLIIRSAADLVIAHNSAGATCAKLFAVENDIAGDGITDNYAAGEVVRFVAPRQGDEIFAILADGENASVGSFLESNGNGELRVVDVDASFTAIAVGSVVGQCLEAVNASDSATTAVADRRIKIEVM